MPLQTGQMLNNRYRIVKLLGQGGFGAVYRAWDTNFEMPCALKENTTTNPGSQRQFMREAKILHTLRHDSLPLVKDYFLIPNQGQYLVMDYIEGADMQTLLNRNLGPLAEEQVLDWLVEICQALEFLHTRTPPIIHRDIKPANIKITPQGRAVLVDFGISKIYDPELPTTQGARGVTPGYSPFEQYGHAPTDERTDVYALGATAYHLLTGKVPEESISRMAGRPLIAPRVINPALSVQTEKAILQAMETMPGQRFQSAAAFCQALQGAIPSILAASEPAKAPAAPDLHMTESVPQPEGAALLKAAKATVKDAAIPAPPAALDRLKSPVLVESTPTPRPKPAAKPAAGKGHRWFWALIVVVVLASSAAGIFAWITHNQDEGAPPPEEPVEEPVGISLEGRWGGFIEQYHEERLNFPTQLVIRHSGRNDFLEGNMVIFLPDENVEEYYFEGTFDGHALTIIDQRGYHYRGELRDESLIGEVAECATCEPRGFFEWVRE